MWKTGRNRAGQIEPFSVLEDRGIAITHFVRTLEGAAVATRQDHRIQSPWISEDHMRTEKRSIPWLMAGLVLCVALVRDESAGSARAAEEKSPSPASRPVTDDDISEAARLALNEGVEIYNGRGEQRNPTECVYFFRGALASLRHLLSRHEALQKDIDRRIAKALALPTDVDRAYALRGVLIEVRLGLAPNPLMAGVGRPEDGKTLWDRLGGEKGVTDIVNDFIDLAIEDKEVNFFRDGKYKKSPEELAKMKRHFVCLTSVITGGPRELVYQGRRLEPGHREMQITNEEFNACLVHIRRSLHRHQVEPKDMDALLKIVETTRKDIVTGKKPAGPPPVTLWERLGDEVGVTKIIDGFIDAAIMDPKVNFFRNGAHKMTPAEIAVMKRHFVCLASALGEGPLKYEGRKMAAIHPDMNITDDEFDCLLEHLRRSLFNNGVRQVDIATIMLAVASTRKDIVTGKKPSVTLWERLGGEVGVTKIIACFIDAAIIDPKVNFFRNGEHNMTPAEIAVMKRHFVCLASRAGRGAPEVRGAQDGSHPPRHENHRRRV